MAEMVDNMLRERLHTAMVRAGTARDNVCPDGNPAEAINRIMVEAWISDPKAGEMMAAITSAGRSVQEAFGDLSSHLTTRWFHEPDEVPATDPRAN